MLPDINKILFATDLSETARHAFTYAVFMADKLNAALEIVHIVREDAPFNTEVLKIGLGEDLFKQLDDQKTQTARDVLIGKKTEALVMGEAISRLADEAEKKLERAEPLTIKEKVIKSKSVSEELLSLVQSGDFDLLVIGHRKRHLLTGGLGDGTLKKVLKRLAIPVMVVPHPNP